MKKLAMIAFVALSLTGCASVLKGSNETINVNSVEKGTTIYVDGAARGLDNASVSLKKGKTYNIRAEKERCETVNATPGESFDPTSLLGILIDFGIFTIPLDLISGAAWKIEPTTYTVTPICKK